MTNLQDRVWAEASVCERKPGPKATKSARSICQCCVWRSGRGREQHEPTPAYGRIPHGPRDSASPPAVAGAASRYCYSIVIGGAHRAKPAQNWPLGESSIVISLL